MSGEPDPCPYCEEWDCECYMSEDLVQDEDPAPFEDPGPTPIPDCVHIPGEEKAIKDD